MPEARLGPLRAGPLVRTLNFHNTPARRAAEYERQLRAAGAWGVGADEDELEALLAGRVRPRRPVVLPLMFEGYRNHYDVALPLLERAGLRGWFLVPTGFLDAPVAEQAAFAGAHELGLTEDEHGDGRFAMSWDELREVAARGHVIACHTATHTGIDALATPEGVHAELVVPRRRLEDELGVRVRTIAFLWGAAHGDGDPADAAMRAAGYRLVVSNARIQRIA